MRIVVLGGGISTERAVSLVSAVNVCRALRSRGHKAIFVDLYFGLENFDGSYEEAFSVPDGFCSEVSIGRSAPDLEKVKASRRLGGKSRIGKGVLEVCALADCVFLGLHGADGEDGKIQAALDLMGIPYTGSDYRSSAMAMDKAVTKRYLEGYGILTPRWQELMLTAENIPELCETLSVPCAVKVIGGGSSIGVALPDTREELREALETVLKVGSRVVVEEKIVGREITQPVFNGEYLCAIEIVPPEGMDFDYVAKYQSGSDGASELCPAPISAEEQKMVGEIAVKVHESLGLSVYSRSDFILDAQGKAWFLEVNTLPGMTPSSLIPKAAAAAGMSYAELCEKIVLLSLKARENS